jgi:REP element-mobilizing transposase RayT
MARPLRIQLAGAVYHITSRGNRREAIYRNDADRAAFLAILASVCERFRWSCHAYCLMTNHYHLVVETTEANLSRGMRQLNGVYAQRFNRVHRCVGHVFQGRYSAVLVQREKHLVALMRYVMLNPVRARMVRSARDWRWSSYRAMVGEAKVPSWLRTDWLTSTFGPGAEGSRAFAQFVKDGPDEGPIGQLVVHRIYLGDAAFVARAQGQVSDLASLVEVPLIQRSRVRPPIGEECRRAMMGNRGDRTARDHAIVAVFTTGHYTMREIGNEFRIHYSWVSRIVRRTGEVDYAGRA